MLRAIEWIQFYFTDFQKFQANGFEDEIFKLAVQREILQSTFRILLVVFSIIIFYVLVINPLRQWIKSTKDNKKGETAFKESLSAKILKVLIMVSIGMAILRIGERYGVRVDFLTEPLGGTGPSEEELKKCDEVPPHPKTDCKIQRDNSYDDFRARVSEITMSGPAGILDRYQETKSKFSAVECPPREQDTATPIDFSCSEAALTARERHKLVTTLVIFVQNLLVVLAFLFLFKQAASDGVHSPTQSTPT